MRRIAHVLLGGLATWMSGTVAATPTEMLTNVDLRTDVGAALCHFDKPKVYSVRSGARTISGQFTVTCAKGARGTRLTTDLSPFARLPIDNKSAYAVQWFFSSDGPACSGDIPSKSSTLLHSAQRSPELVKPSDGTKVTWHYCAQLSNDQLPAPAIWPLQGEFSLTLVDSQDEVQLLEDASRIYVWFDKNSSVLSKDIAELLDGIMGSLGDLNNYYVQLHGHASLEGTQVHNQQLSVMRLKRVREYLFQHYGIKPSQTWGQAWGESRPMALNTESDEGPQNRRVDVIIIPKAKAEAVPATVVTQGFVFPDEK